METEFGYYPNRFEYQGSKIKITTRADLTTIKAEVSSWSSVEKDWAYGPPVQQINMFDPEHVQVLPYPSRIFGLPMTHRLEHPDTDTHRLWFLVWVFGFIVGMRMTPKNPGFIDSAPLKQGALTDFDGGKKELEVGLECADALWDKHGSDSKGLRSLEGAINALWLAQGRNTLHFEQFTYAYFAIDACWRACAELLGLGIPTKAGKLKDPLHGDRITEMAKHFSLELPGWPDLPGVRHSLMHEALVSDGSRPLPLGHALIQNPRDPHSSLPHEMCNFVCRVLVGLLGIPADTYIKSSMITRQVMGLLD